ncbi:MAG: adenosylcobinamide-phosphate synthase CbiB [Arcobacteraceae bacterium]|jgi:adenosylcobinamide-phosphate synthase|nr:adenosylcobinamide-phosphate synthase CbiB [Arcobacteraceae bacterium]
MYFELTFFAYLIDRIFGEFSFLKKYKHPIIFMGEFIQWFEKKFYKDSILRGFYLTLSLLCIVFCITSTLEYFIENIYILALVASSGIASKMLYESVKGVIDNPQNIKYLVSRDTGNLTQNDINKATIETYGENLSDGVIAPLFYLFCFGIVGLFIYKAINTLDSMVGYKNERYEKFGKISAKLDDVVNYIPSRLTAILISLLFWNFDALKKFYSFGKLHDSPNAGHPISALALSLGIKLGGDTSYFGKIKKKPYFGDGLTQISSNDIEKALLFRDRFDILLLTLFILYTTL